MSLSFKPLGRWCHHGPLTLTQLGSEFLPNHPLTPGNKPGLPQAGNGPLGGESRVPAGPRVGAGAAGRVHRARDERTSGDMSHRTSCFRSDQKLHDTNENYFSTSAIWP